MRVCAAEASLVPRRVRDQLSYPGAASTGPMSDRAPHRRMLAPQKDRRRMAEPGQVDPAGGVEQQNENDPHPGPFRGGSPAPHRGLRALAGEAIPRSAPRRVAGSRPIPVPLASQPHHSGHARHKVSEAPGIADGQDRRQRVLKAVPRLPIGLNKRALAKRAAGLLRKVAGPAVPGQPDSTNPDSTNRGLTNPGLTNRGSPSRDGRSHEQPGPLHPVHPLRRVRTEVRNPGRITTVRVLPAMPGRGRSLALAEGQKDAAIAARGRPLSPGPNLPGLGLPSPGRRSPGHGLAARGQNQESPAFAGASRIGKTPEHDRQPQPTPGGRH